MYRNLQNHKHKSDFTYQYVHLNNISKTSYIRFYCLVSTVTAGRLYAPHNQALADTFIHDINKQKK